MKILLLGTGKQGIIDLYDLVESGDVKEISAADYNINLLKEFVYRNNNETKIKCEFVIASNQNSLNNVLLCNPDLIIVDLHLLNDEPVIIDSIAINRK